MFSVFIDVLESVELRLIDCSAKVGLNGNWIVVFCWSMIWGREIGLAPIAGISLTQDTPVFCISSHHCVCSCLLRTLSFLRSPWTNL